MPVTDSIVTAEEYRRAVGRPDTNEDDEILLDLKAVSRDVERELRGDGRHFTKTAAVEARVFYPPNPWCSYLIVDDIADSAGLVVKLDLNRDGVFETTLAATDFYPWPQNAAKGSEPRPFTQLRLAPSSRYVYWPDRIAVEVTATYGWPLGVAPQAVKALVIQRAAMLRLESPRAVGELPEGDTGASDVSHGAQRTLLELVEPYRRQWVYE